MSESKPGGIQFFIYDTIKIMVLLGVLIFFISYIQSCFPPERTKKILGRFHGIGANCIAAPLGTELVTQQIFGEDILCILVFHERTAFLYSKYSIYLQRLQYRFLLGNTARPLCVRYAVQISVRLPKFDAGLQAKYTLLYATSRRIDVIFDDVGNHDG